MLAFVGLDTEHNPHLYVSPSVSGCPVLYSKKEYVRGDRILIAI